MYTTDDLRRMNSEEFDLRLTAIIHDLTVEVERLLFKVRSLEEKMANVVHGPMPMPPSPY